jgi:hypothetical protein
VNSDADFKENSHANFKEFLRCSNKKRTLSTNSLPSSYYSFPSGSLKENLDAKRFDAGWSIDVGS